MFNFPWRPSGNRLEDAQNAFDKLTMARGGIRKQIDEIDAELVTTQASGAGQLLSVQLGAADESEGTLTTIARLETRRATLARALEIADNEIRLAEGELLRGKAETKRTDAVKLRAEADGREPKEQELRAELEAFEECTYAPAQPARAANHGGAMGGNPFIVRVPTRKTTLLRMRADALESEAAELLRQATRLAPSITTSEEIAQSA